MRYRIEKLCRRRRTVPQADQHLSIQQRALASTPRYPIERFAAN